MDKIQVTIAPKVKVLINEDMLDMLNLIATQNEVCHQNLTLHQQATVAKMLNRTLLIKRRKNGKVSYKIRNGVCWEQN